MAVKKSKRGFASPNFDKELARKIHSMGGKASKGGGRKPKAQPQQESNHE